MAIVIGGVLLQRPKIFKRGIFLMVAPSPINDNPKVLASLHSNDLFASYTNVKFKSNNSPLIFFLDGWHLKVFANCLGKFEKSCKPRRLYHSAGNVLAMKKSVMFRTYLIALVAWLLNNN
jgi:hypothetical protein